ncbi:MULTISPECIES: type II secretion system F family protein [unclassified Arthrobacter]|uniref:type II secretion system F family protein n=1 Tax=unclassified Arthrobacter TaxID=235627 RepID=UPI001D15B013|nr:MULTISPECIES: type II secretion system F family protein [unclassified Arthrobacter]MCC3290067.1 type II secretion system F family protein [Arthrobacter sp. zg-Y1110]MCC3300421.1 type II secretion system F family protein [Arthrobacter sp. zg-Y895]UWX84538.1 type II secretion system F family protein [Arthrobacter sp. zg-Y1110]
MTGLLVFAFLSTAALLLTGSGGHPRQQHLRQRTEPGSEGSTGDPALMLDLIAAMLEAGQPLPSALAILRGGVDPATSRDLERLLRALDLGIPWDAAWQLSAVSAPAGAQPAGAEPADAERVSRASGMPISALAALGPALRFTAVTGAPSAAVLHSQADALRRRRQTESRRRAAALGVRLVMPLGLCSLPAFVALTVVPLLMSLLPGWN